MYSSLLATSFASCARARQRAVGCDFYQQLRTIDKVRAPGVGEGWRRAMVGGSPFRADTNVM